MDWQGSWRRSIWGLACCVFLVLVTRDRDRAQEDEGKERKKRLESYSVLAYIRTFLARLLQCPELSIFPLIPLRRR